MERKLGSITTFHIGAVQLIVAQVLMPNIHFLVPVNKYVMSVTPASDELEYLSSSI